MLQKEDVLMLVTLTLISDVIIYYFPQALDQSKINDLAYACKYFTELQAVHPILKKN